MKKHPSEQSAVRLVLALQEGWELGLIRTGNRMTLHADAPNEIGTPEYTIDLSGGGDWLGELLDQAGVPKYLE